MLFFSAATGLEGAGRHGLSREEAACSAQKFVVLVLDQLPTLNARWQGFGVGEVLRIRAGIASGYCSLGQWGRSDVRAYTMVGTCVGLAERMQSVSSEDSLAICPVSARLLMNTPLSSTLSSTLSSSLSSSSPGVTAMPEEFETRVCGRRLFYLSTELSLKGFARMRVYRASDKVRALSK